MALVVLDASVVIGFLDPDDPLHEAAVSALTEHQHDELVVPASVYAEILVGPYRKGARAVAAVEAFLADFAIRIAPITPAIARAAARLRGGSKGVRLPDALVLATADEVGADRVLTGDDSWTRIARRVTLVHGR
ncbi:MAG TPA: type II toxin-antitoxin system VapC family toxin [Gaiellaceae bacterium]|nr:type II toxin-antitoxin system VapC family toxin [Gaiellaceae bacterium]